VFRGKWKGYGAAHMRLRDNKVFGDVWVGQWSSGALVFQLE